MSPSVRLLGTRTGKHTQRVLLGPPEGHEPVACQLVEHETATVEKVDLACVIIHSVHRQR